MACHWLESTDESEHNDDDNVGKRRAIFVEFECGACACVRAYKRDKKTKRVSGHLDILTF